MRCALSKLGLRWMLLLTVLLAAASSVSATTAVIPADDDLIIGARAIVRGRVLAVECAFDTAEDRIYTYTTLRVLDVIKGRITTRRIVIKEAGGQVGSQGSIIFGTPQFKTDDEVFVYLDTRNDGSLRVHQMFLGKFTVTDDPATGRRIVTRDGPEANVVVEEHAHADGSRGPATDRMELAAYTAMVRARLAANLQRSRAFERTYYANVALRPEPSEYRRVAGGVSAQFNFITNPPVRWFEPDAGVPLAFKVNLDGAPTSQTVDDINAAMNAWSTVPGCSMRVVVGETGAFCFGRGSNTITFNNCDQQFAPTAGCASILAIGGVNWDAGQVRTVNGVTFYAANTGHVSFNPYASCDYGDHLIVREIATHEMGHALGLGHSWNPCSGCPPPTPAQLEATMYGVAHFDGRGATLKQDDTNGIIFMYPGASAGPGPLTIITVTPLQSGLVNQVYSQSVVASGGTAPYQWALASGSGPLPAGLTINTSGLIAGTPTAEGTSIFTVKVTDAGGGTSQKDFAIIITQPGSPFDSTFKSQDVPGKVDPDQSFLADLKFTNNGTQTWGAGSIYLRSQNPADNGVWGGNLVPIFTAAGPGEDLDIRFFAFAPHTPGVYNFQWQLYQDGLGWFGQKSINLSITVGDGIGPPSVSSGTTATAVQGQDFTFPLGVSGGLAPFTWGISAGALPPGVSLNPASGLIAGTPTAAGTAAFTATVTDSRSQKGSLAMIITVLPPPLDMKTTALPDGQQGVAYNQQLAAAGGTLPYTWSIAAGSFPAGLNLSSTGVIGGTPGAAGTFNVTVAVVDANATTIRRALTLTITPPQLSLDLATLLQTTEGQAFSYQPAASGGRQPYTWSITSGALPAGLTINATSGLVSGTTTAAGLFAVTITVRDQDNRVASAGLQIKVIDPATIPAITHAKYKNGKKLLVTGDRFNAAAVLFVDGVQMTATPSDGSFVAKPLSLSFGPHELKVVNPGGVASQPFTLTVH